MLLARPQSVSLGKFGDFNHPTGPMTPQGEEAQRAQERLLLGQGAASSDGRASAHTERLEEGQGVDAWRFLLGLDSESFEENIDVVAAGRPLLPEHVSAMVTETVANYGAHDRAVMTVSFVRFLRLLMSEVMQAFEHGVLADGARTRGEVLVEVPVDPLPGDGDGDGTSLMQRTLTGQIQDDFRSSAAMVSASSHVAGGVGKTTRWMSQRQHCRAAGATTTTSRHSRRKQG